MCVYFAREHWRCILFERHPNENEIDPYENSPLLSVSLYFALFFLLLSSSQFKFNLSICDHTFLPCDWYLSVTKSRNLLKQLKETEDKILYVLRDRCTKKQTLNHRRRSTDQGRINWLHLRRHYFDSTSYNLNYRLKQPQWNVSILDLLLPTMRDRMIASSLGFPEITKNHNVVKMMSRWEDD